MYRLSLIISEIYNKYLPLAEKDGIILNLDFSDTTKEIADPERVKQYLDDNLSSTLKRSDKGEVTIGVDKSAITITDSGTTLSRSACALLSNRYIDVTSRVGFGTTIKIFLQPRELPEQSAPAQAPLEVEGVAVSAAVDKAATEPTMQGEVKLAAKKGKQKLGIGARLRLKGKKSKTSTTSKQLKSGSSTPAKSKPKAKSTKKTSRQLAAAARKADREVKRIAKKASKQSRKLTSKQNRKAVTKSSQKSKKAQKPAKRKTKRLELS